LVKNALSGLVRLLQNQFPRGALLWVYPRG